MPAVGSEATEIRNETIAVAWDAQRGVSITVASAPRPFVAGGQLREAGQKASVSRVTDPTFGDSQVLRVSHARGGRGRNPAGG